MVSDKLVTMVTAYKNFCNKIQDSFPNYDQNYSSSKLLTLFDLERKRQIMYIRSFNTFCCGMRCH